MSGLVSLGLAAPAHGPLPFPAPRRTGRRVALLARYPERDPAMPQFIPNHGLRMVEAALRAAGARGRLDGLEVAVWDLEAEGLGADADALAREVAAFDPDVVGFSAYLWSFPFLVEVAERLRADDPARLHVFGGPSARPSMFAQPPFRARAGAADALVINDGEETFAEIVEARDRSDSALRAVRGLTVRDAEGAWRETPPRPLSDLSALPSPYKMGLVQHGGLGVLQTYRGCPFTCSFCEWGTMESPRRVRGVEDLREEFAGMAGHRVDAALLVDAGLNLNAGAFRNLRAAAESSDFLSRRGLICEVYPSKVRQEHLDFLKGIGRAYVGVGLQSFDNHVLANVERHYDEARFDETLRALGEVAAVAVEIIVGLPGDSPERFRRNFERARRLPCTLRVYHCVVLPSALMVRSPPEHALDYDPVTLKMRGCLGWPPAALAETADFLTREARRGGGRPGEYFWIYPPARAA